MRPFGIVPGTSSSSWTQAGWPDTMWCCLSVSESFSELQTVSQSNLYIRPTQKTPSSQSKGAFTFAPSLLGPGFWSFPFDPIQIDRCESSHGPWSQNKEPNILDVLDFCSVKGFSIVWTFSPLTGSSCHQPAHEEMLEVQNPIGRQQSNVICQHKFFPILSSR